MRQIRNIFASAIVSLAAFCPEADAKDVLLPYGDMNRWTIRQIKESAVIGGDTKTLYAVGPNRTLTGNKPYVNGGGRLCLHAEALEFVHPVTGKRMKFERRAGF